MFVLDNVLPIPLQEQVRPNSDIWQCSRPLEAAQRYFVSAASGKGKTTLQHILYGLRKDYSGAVRVQTESIQGDIQALSLDQWAKLRQRHIAVIFQDLRLFLNLTAWENLQLKNQLTNHCTDDQMREMAAELGVDSLLEKTCETLSYGQRQRVAIVRALCQPFDTLLMDEPFSHLDTDNIKKCCSLIKRVCGEQRAGFILASLGDSYFFEYDYNLSL